MSEDYDSYGRCLRAQNPLPASGRHVARERRELIVTKRGKPIARLVPISEVSANETLTRLRGTLIGGNRVEDFDTGTVWDATRR